MSNVKDLEPGAQNHEHLADGVDNDTALRKIRTAGSISISPDLFEKLYLSPENKVKGELRRTFGNPTPIALVGFLLSLTPLTCDLLGWRGAGGLGGVDVGAYFGFGAILMIIGGIFELILGNTFPAIVFTSFGAFWFTFGGFLVPGFGSPSQYVADGGAKGPTYANSIAFFFLWMGFLCFIYLIAALRVNVVFVGIFACLVPAFSCLAASYWYTGAGQKEMAANLLTAGGAFVFVVSMLGWYIFFVQTLASVDFPVNLPVGDLSGVIKGASQRKKAAKDEFYEWPTWSLVYGAAASLFSNLFVRVSWIRPINISLPRRVTCQGLIRASSVVPAPARA